tara:strand:- start:502 stop:1647 length:1146 start_codon:yes stop_codon:yes gene_type:complete
MARSKKENRAGKLSAADLRSRLNKKAGLNVAHDLKEDNPTEVKDWIPTGSRWLDSIICRGQLAGIPVGKVVEIAGLEATGKSFMACQIASNAQKKGIQVVYFDSESAMSPEFLEKGGVDLTDFIYVQATSVEQVLESIEELLGTENQFLFIWDSLALTPAISDVEGDFNPQSSMAVKARILAKAMSKLTIPIANSNSTLLVLNQLKTNITRSPSEALTRPYVTPGGKALIYAYSLRIWLTGRRAKSSRVLDENGFQIGSEVKVRIEKSRFGTQNRACNFRILWGSEVGIQDDESLLDAIKHTDSIEQSGAWYSLIFADGTKEKFQGRTWTEKLQIPAFRQRVYDIMDEEIIYKFDRREGNASAFYDNDEAPEETQVEIEIG